MPSAIENAFGLTAREYDRAQQQLVPCFDHFYRKAVEPSPFRPKMLARQFFERDSLCTVKLYWHCSWLPCSRVVCRQINQSLLTMRHTSVITQRCVTSRQDTTSLYGLVPAFIFLKLINLS